jgi:RimJ/RimL family protein N-acetyltransferase
VASPTLETPRLILRGWRDADVDAWIAMNADPRVMEFFPSRYAPDRAAAVAALLRAELERDGFGWWVVEVKNGPAFAGVVALQTVPFEARFTPAHEIGWRFAFDMWGHGYATEGARAALEFAFQQLGWNEIIAMTAALNQRSQRVMQRLGMTRSPEDDFLHPRITEGDRLRPHVLYRIKPKWS